MSRDTLGAGISGKQDEPYDCFDEAYVLTDDSEKNKK